jgi:guanylate kinase
VIIALVGSSGAGKSTTIRAGLERGLFDTIVPHTTRAPRPAELEGRDYHFVSRDRFTQMITAAELDLWDYTFGHYYGYSVGLRDAALSDRWYVVPILGRSAVRIRYEWSGVRAIFLGSPSSVLDERMGDHDVPAAELEPRRWARAEDDEMGRMCDLHIDSGEGVDSALHAIQALVSGEL